MQEEQILIQAGLSEEQALTYQALLDKGPQKASNLSSWTGIKRGLTYKILQELENMRLVEKKEPATGVATFFPLHPNALLDGLEKKKQEIDRSKEVLNHSLSSLISKYNLQYNKPTVRFFEGLSGIRTVLFDSINSKTEILTYADNEAFNTLYPNINKEYVTARKGSKIKKRIISVDTPYIRELAKSDDPEFTQRMVLKQSFNFATAMQIYDGKVTYITLEKERMIGVIIEDTSIYEMHRALFEAHWNQAAILADSASV